MDVHIHSNVEEVYREVRVAFARFPSEMARAHAENARTIREAAEVEADLLIYSSPPSIGYVRTTDLLRSHKVLPLSEFSWLLINDVPYAEYVHDGTSQVEARPWMANAIELVQAELDDNLLDTGERVLSGSAG